MRECAAVGAGGDELQRIPGALLNLGIEEMSFMGDSHMRALVISLVYGVMVAQDPGYQVDQSKHGNCFFELPVMGT